MSRIIPNALQKIRRVADYQFGRGVGERLFPSNVAVVFSKRTGKIRHVYLDKKLLATLRPTDGFFSLTIEGAKWFMETVELRRSWVEVREEVIAFVEKGRDVFAKHVVDADEEIRPGEEVIVLDGENRVVAVGKALLSGREMKGFRSGVAVKVRRGRLEKIKKEKRTLVDD